MKRKIIATILVLLSLIMLFNLYGCQNRFMNPSKLKQIDKNPTGYIIFEYEMNGIAKRSERMEFELFYEKAPITVTNFIKLANSGYYDGLVIHRIEKSENNFLVQGGGYEFDDRTLVEALGLKYTIKGEFSENGWENNDISHIPGTLSMARTDDMDSANSQFFITLSDCSEAYDGKYAAFGRLLSITSNFSNDMFTMTMTSKSVEGVYMSSFPLYTVTIKEVSVNTHGVDFGNPLTIKAK